MSSGDVAIMWVDIDHDAKTQGFSATSMSNISSLL